MRRVPGSRALLLALFLAVSGTSAQDVSSLPACGQTCVTNLFANGFGCEPGATACVCSKSDFQFGVRDCAEQACLADEVAAVTNGVTALCATAVATPPANTQPSAENTAPPVATSAPISSPVISDPVPSSSAAPPPPPPPPATSTPASVPVTSVSTNPPSTSSPVSTPTAAPTSSASDNQAIVSATTSEASTSPAPATSSTATQSSSSSSPAAATSTPTSGPSPGLSKSAKIGVGVGVTVAAAGAVAAGVLFVVMRRRRRNGDSGSGSGIGMSGIGWPKGRSGAGYLRQVSPPTMVSSSTSGFGSEVAFSRYETGLSELETRSRRYEDMVPRERPRYIV